MRCIQCKGPFHPATGDYNRADDVATCGACIRAFYDWLKGHTRRRWQKMRFYEHTETSRRVP